MFLTDKFIVHANPCGVCSGQNGWSSSLSVTPRNLVFQSLGRAHERCLVFQHLYNSSWLREGQSVLPLRLEGFVVCVLTKVLQVNT